MRSRVFVVLGLLCPIGFARGEEPRFNQIQVIGTHNSYHVAPAPEVLALIAGTGKSRAESLEYTHRPLAEQFGRLGIRQIELDVYADPRGGLFSKPNLRTLAKLAGPDPNAGGILDKPGFKVLHIADVDFLSTVPTLLDGLKQIRDWSKANPKHVPITVLLELKDDAVPLMPVKPLPFDRELLNAVEAEILSVFRIEDLLTPDRLRGDFETLPDAIRKRGWPTLDEVRGKVMFCIDNTGKLPNLYREDHPALKGRRMFATYPENSPEAAFFKINDPKADFDRIRRLVGEGYIVRTRADEPTRHARTNDTAMRDKALASGAQFVSSDYPEPNKAWSDYCVRFSKGRIARPNPVSGAAFPVERDLETGKD
jgi:Phosphoinositide phospholipase C, Ca2+-dependent